MSGSRQTIWLHDICTKGLITQKYCSPPSTFPLEISADYICYGEIIQEHNLRFCQQCVQIWIIPNIINNYFYKYYLDKKFGEIAGVTEW